MAVPAKKVRKARQYLRKRAKAGVRDISPVRFAAAAEEQKSSFGEIMRVLRYYYSSGEERAEMRRGQLLRRGQV